MKKTYIILLFLCAITTSKAQSCQELMNYIKSESLGTTYTSYNSDAISKVTFYQITEEYKTLYFAIVCFKKEYSYTCNEYLYQVASNTKSNYAINYYNSAGKAFLDYIQPYANVLGCSPKFN